MIEIEAEVFFRVAANVKKFRVNSAFMVETQVGNFVEVKIEVVLEAVVFGKLSVEVKVLIETSSRSMLSLW